MQTLASVVTRRERKMLGALFAVGTEGSISSVMGNTTLPAYRGHLNYLTCPISGTEQTRIVPHKRGVGSREADNGDVGMGSAKGSECCAVIAQIEVASPVRDNITSPETEQTFRWCSHSRPFMEPMQEAKQMTTAQAVGAASHTSGEFSIAVRIGCKPV